MRPTMASLGKLNETACFLAASGGPDIFLTIFNVLSAYPFPNFLAGLSLAVRDMAQSPYKYVLHKYEHT